MGKLLPRPKEIGQWADKLLVEQVWRRGSDPQNPWDLGAIAHTSHMCNPVTSAVRWKAGTGESWKVTRLEYAIADNKRPCPKVEDRTCTRGYPLTSTRVLEDVLVPSTYTRTYMHSAWTKVKNV